MNPERREWRDQFARNIGARETMRFALAFLGMVFLGVALSILAGSTTLSTTVFAIFLIALFIFPALSLKWRSTYRVLRFILGNSNLPQDPIPPGTRNKAKHPRLNFLIGGWWLLMALLLIIVALRYIAK